MAKKITILCGSPRPGGNTNTLVNWVTEAAEAAGASVERVDVTRLYAKAPGCTACMGCQKREEFTCVLDDEVSDVVAALPSADVIVFATPVFFFGPTAQLKVVLDRMFSLFKMSELEGTRRHAVQNSDLALIATAGGEMEHGLEGTVQVFEMLAGFLGRPLKKLLLPAAPTDPQLLARNDEHRGKALAFGRELAGM